MHNTDTQFAEWKKTGDGKRNENSRGGGEIERWRQIKNKQITNKNLRVNFMALLFVVFVDFSFESAGNILNTQHLCLFVFFLYIKRLAIWKEKYRKNFWTLNVLRDSKRW